MAETITKKIEASAAQALMGSATDWRQYDGLRIGSHSSPAIYLAMWGQLHWIPNPATFNSVFKDWNGVVTSDYLVDNMPKTTALSDQSFIAISAASPAQYLVSMGQKFWIPSPAAVTKFNFRGPTTIPVLALQYIPTGPDVT